MKTMIFVLATCLLTPSAFAKDNLVFEEKKIILTNPKPLYNLELHYPQIKAPLTKAEENFNHLAKEKVTQEIAEFKKSPNLTDSLIPPEIKANPSSLIVLYDLTTIEPRTLVSVRFLTATYYSGTAHPSEQYASLNFDLIQNKALSLADIFKKSDYLPKIAKISEKQVTQRIKAQSGQAASLFPEGFEPIPNNYRVWNVTAKGMKFTFGEDQVSSRVYGPQTAVIPYPVLKPIAANTVLSNCLKTNHCDIKTLASSTKQ